MCAQSVLDRRLEAGVLYEARELCVGGELFDEIAADGDMLSTGRMPQALRWFAQAASAVSHAHSLRVGNGQLRPEHMLLACEETAQGREATVRLLGFEPAAWAEYKHGSLESAGDTLAAPSPTASPPQHSERDADDEVSLSKAAERSSSSGSGSGSATASTSSASRRLPLHRPPWKYDAPELDGVKGTTIEGIMKADVWSLGVMLTVLLSGSPPRLQYGPSSAASPGQKRVHESPTASPQTTRAHGPGETSSSTGTTPAGSSAQPPLSVYLPTGMSAAPTAVLELVRSMLDPTPAERPSASVVKSAADMLVMPPPSLPISSSSPGGRPVEGGVGPTPRTSSVIVQRSGHSVWPLSRAGNTRRRE